MRVPSSLRFCASLALLLPLAHCSCQRQPGADATVAVPVDAELSVPGPEVARAEISQRAAAEATTNAANLAASTLHAYLGALPAADRSRADAFWSGGAPGTPADDALLRGIEGLRSMHIQNEAPQALDRESPPRAFEVPVRLRLDTATGPVRVQGWYRLRAKVDGRGWEITSASLDPIVD
jgi:hypothetical protein